jgi:glutamate synthase domain-containing protein 3
VDLEPVIDPADIEMLQRLIARHFQLTGSSRAQWILGNWNSLLATFVKVFPHEYKRVLGIPRLEKRASEAMPLPPPPAALPLPSHIVLGD